METTHEPTPQKSGTSPLTTSPRPATPPAKTKILKPQHTERKIDESSEQSFPASDPPAWSGSTAQKSDD